MFDFFNIDLVKSVLNSLSAHIAVLDKQGIIKYVNQAWVDFAIDNGLEADKCSEGINYLDVFEYIDGDLNQEILTMKQGIEDVINDKKEMFIQEYPCHSPTEQRWFEMRVTKFSGSGRCKVVVTHENITKRKVQEKQLKTVKEFNENILNNLEELIFYLDVDLNVKWANKIAQKHFNLSLSEMKSQLCYEKWGDDSPCEGCPIVKAKESGKSEERIMKKPDGSVLLMKAIPDFDEQGQIKGFIEVSLDISKQKKAEKKIKQVINRLEEQFEKAGQLHDQFLPTKMPKLEDITLGTYYSPADRLGGDFYNFIELEEQLIFYISDVSGHDLSGSMLNIFLKETINSYLIAQNNKEGLINPGQIIDFINKHFNEEGFPADYFICLIIGVLDLNTKELRYSNAGIQFSPLLIKENKKAKSFSCGGLPICFASSELELEYKECSFLLEPRDIFFLYTDGLIEQDNGSEIYGEERLVKLLNRSNYSKPEQIIEGVNADFNNFKKDIVVQDDITYLLIQHEDNP